MWGQGIARFTYVGKKMSFGCRSGALQNFNKLVMLVFCGIVKKLSSLLKCVE